MTMNETDILDAENIGTKKKNGKKGFDPYQIVTDKIIDYMESGKFEQLPSLWARTGGARNAHTGRAYNGINTILLAIRMDEEQWEHPLFLTFNQVRQINKLEKMVKLQKTEVVEGKKRTVYPVFVKKGSKGEQVCFWKRIEVKDDEDGEKTIPLLRLYTVFNVDQLEMHPDARDYVMKHMPPVKYTNNGERNEAVDTFLRNVGMEIRYGGDQAFYNSREDFIGMPNQSKFPSMDGYYAVQFHEHGHGTGHKDRLNRDLKNRFGSEAYAFEELVAEFTASFLCADFNIYQESWRHHAEYVRTWVSRMKEDKRAIFKAASLANQAVNYLWEKQPEDLRNVDAA